eukprot:CAMPEP_0178908010 /NCGR_PEP_ID=MMETSP0786-20121207/7686_1 /TAXON_ID=186022 /ORGANISM="Thalassionema frauenfeldii, Strain CCMP 1798" /LENGTH=246 /DNA_ID=CAMNT_0020579867 /DNA_START=113 /DNA_END=850 /DNA_ORIENTATION=-
MKALRIIMCAFLQKPVLSFIVGNLIDTSSKRIKTCFVAQDNLPSVISSPVLVSVYPRLLEWKSKYGHPNIPLKTDGGNECKILRRLHVEKKLTEEEISLLNDIGFQFNSLEDVYREADFTEMIARLIAYEKEYSNRYQVPKKFPNDPVLGAWVTGVRRLGPEGVLPEHAQQLNDVQFTWVSSRKCGSKFMTKFRELTQRVEKEGLDVVLDDKEVKKWITAQQLARERGKLSDTRFHYMENLVGEKW